MIETDENFKLGIGKSRRATLLYLKESLELRLVLRKLEDRKSNVARRPIVGVIDSGGEGPGDLAYLLGKMIAQKGYILLTGGVPAAMEAASKGAHEAHGLVIGILPSEKRYPRKGYPNGYVDVAIYTGMSDARNAINAKSSDVIVALSGGAGTLSEIALAIKSGTPVVGLDCPAIGVDTCGLFVKVSSVEDALREVEKYLESRNELE